MNEPTATPIGKIEDLFDPRFSRSMNVLQRIHLAQSRIRYIQKDKPKAQEGGKQLRYTIVSHDKVTAEARSALHPCGVIYWPLGDSFKMTVDGNITMLQLTVRFASIDDRDDYIDVDGIGFGIDTGDKGPGKATSYAVKYALLKALELETGDDPDLDQEVQRRSSLAQRAETFELDISNCKDAGELKLLLELDASRQISSALQDREPAEYRRLRQVVAKKAREVELDLSTVGQ